jgi:hypothetical protein
MKKLKKLTFDKEFTKDNETKRLVYGCYCDNVRIFTIQWQTDFHGKDEGGYWWISEGFFPSSVWQMLTDHPVNKEIRKYLRVEMKTKEDVINACNELFKIYTGLFYE